MSKSITETVVIDGQCYTRTRYQYAPAEYAVDKYRMSSGCLYTARLNPKAHAKIISKIEQELGR